MCALWASRRRCRRGTSPEEMRLIFSSFPHARAPMQAAPHAPLQVGAPGASLAMPRFVEAAVRGDRATMEEMLKETALPGAWLSVYMASLVGYGM